MLPAWQRADSFHSVMTIFNMCQKSALEKAEGVTVFLGSVNGHHMPAFDIQANTNTATAK